MMCFRALETFKVAIEQIVQIRKAATVARDRSKGGYKVPSTSRRQTMKNKTKETQSQIAQFVIIVSNN
jgi:hypothetical protein